MNNTIYILDTDVLSDWEEHPGKIEKTIQSFYPDQLAITVVSVYEQLRGWFPKFAKAKTSKDIARFSEKIINLIKLYCSIKILPFTTTAAEIYDTFTPQQIRKIGPMDSRIAAIVLSVKGTIITKNVSHFSLVPNLIIKNPFS